MRHRLVLISRTSIARDRTSTATAIAATFLAVALILSMPLGLVAQSEDEPSSFLADGRALHTATLLDDGTVLIAGGFSGLFWGSLDSAELYDPVTRTFERVGSMSTARAGHKAVRLADGRVLVAGGVEPTLEASMEVYDPAARAFTSAGSAGRLTGFSLTATNDGGAIIVGGEDGSFDYSRSIRYLDGGSLELLEIGRLANGRTNHIALPLLDGRVLLIAGSSDDPFVDRSAALVDPADGSSTLIDDPLGDGLVHTPAAVLEDGRVLIARDNGNWLFDAVTETFERSLPFVHPRSGSSITGLGDGGGLIAGGSDIRGSLVASVERFDPIAGSFTTVGALTWPRTGHTATALADGTVLILGGFDGQGFLSSAEIFGPIARHVDPIGVDPDAAPAALRLGYETGADDDLALRFPVMVANETLRPTTLSAATWLGVIAAEEPEGDGVELFRDQLEAAGIDADAVTLGFASIDPALGRRATISALRLPGADASAHIDLVVSLILSHIRVPTFEPVIVADREVARVTDGGMPGAYPIHVIALDDVVWIIAAEEPALGDILRGLPEPEADDARRHGG